MPGMSGSRGMFSEPTALMTNRASRTSAVPSGFAMATCQELVGSSQRERRHRGAETAVVAELVLVEHADEVVAQLGLLAVVLGPVMRGLERVAVVMASDVDARTRVPVLPPGTTGTLVLLDDHEGKAGLRQTDPREDARKAATDHDDRRGRLRLVRHLVAPARSRRCRRRRTACPRRTSAPSRPRAACPRGTPSSRRGRRGAARAGRIPRRGRRRWPAPRAAEAPRARRRRDRPAGPPCPACSRATPRGSTRDRPSCAPASTTTREPTRPRARRRWRRRRRRTARRRGDSAPRSPR